MATRLYVNTKDPLVLEALVDVPRGTYDKCVKLNNLPDSIWEKVEVRKRLMAAMKLNSLDELHQESYGFDSMHMSILWMMYVVSQPVRSMNSFVSEGFGRIQIDKSYLQRITRDEHGASVGSTRIFTQVTNILRAQADDNRLIFDAEDWTIQSLTYMGSAFVTTGRIDISNTNIWQRGPRVKISKLEGVCWH